MHRFFAILIVVASLFACAGCDSGSNTSFAPASSSDTASFDNKPVSAAGYASISPVLLTSRMEFVTNGEVATENDAYHDVQVKLFTDYTHGLPFAVTAGLEIVRSNTTTYTVDYSLSSKTATFPAGSRNGDITTFRIFIKDDTELENPEVADFHLIPVRGGYCTLTQNIDYRLIIHDNEDTHLYGCKTGSNLLAIDPQTGAFKERGLWSTGFGKPRAAYDPAKDAVLLFQSNVFSLNPYTADKALRTSLKALPEIVDHVTFNASQNLFYVITHSIYTSVYNFWQVDGGTGLAQHIAQLTISPSNYSSCMCYDQNVQLVYLVSYSGNPVKLYSIQPTTGLVTLVGNVGSGSPYSAIRSIAFNPATNTLYAGSSSNLLTIDTTTGAGTVVGISPNTDLSYIAFDTLRQKVVSLANGRMYRVDLTTLASEFVGCYDFIDTIVDITYDTLNKKVYAHNMDFLTSEQNLYTLNIFTNQVRQVADFGDNMVGIAYHPTQNCFYTIQDPDSGYCRLFKYDLSNHTFTDIGTVPVYQARSLSYDEATGFLFSMTPSQLLRIDPQNANTTIVGSFGITGASLMGLESSLTQNTLIAFSFQSAFSVDKNTGQATSLGPVPFRYGAIPIQGGGCSACYFPDTNQLFSMNGVGSSHDSLLIDLSSFTTKTICGCYALSSIAYHSTNNQAYCLHRSNVELGLGTVDLVSGNASHIAYAGMLYSGQRDELMYNATQNKLVAATLYGTSLHLLEVDPSSGAATPITPLSIPSANAIAFNDFYSEYHWLTISYGSGLFLSLNQIDPTNGQTTLLGQAPCIYTNCEGLAEKPSDGKLYTVVEAYTGPFNFYRLVVFDPTTMSFVEVGATCSVSGLAWK